MDILIGISILIFLRVKSSGKHFSFIFFKIIIRYSKICVNRKRASSSFWCRRGWKRVIFVAIFTIVSFSKRLVIVSVRIFRILIRIIVIYLFSKLFINCNFSIRLKVLIKFIKPAIFNLVILVLDKFFLLPNKIAL